ncbi:MAG: 30S ribosomal protein S9 [Chloroflexota bacterium]|nr:30S ribosomal protein S9 [Chloroflexota bacterium]
MAMEYYEAVGRRKTATARVRIFTEGTGAITINGRPLEEYFAREGDILCLKEPFKMTATENRFDTSVKVSGGGMSGQAGAIRLGIARALLKMDPDMRSILRKGGFLTRDARVKERKKPGLKGARKAPQYTKR